MQHTCEYLFPKALRRTQTNQKKILFIGSCMVGDAVQHYRSWYAGVDFEYILFNNAYNLPDMTAEEIAKYDYQVIQPGIRYVITDEIVDFFAFNKLKDVNGFILDCVDRLKLIVNQAIKYNLDHGIITFISNFAVPTTPAFASLARSNSEYDISYIIKRMNIELAKIVSQHKNIYILDLEAIASTIGKRFFLDDGMAFFLHGGFWYEGHIEDEKKRIEQVPPLSEISENKSYEIMQAIYDNADYLFRIINQTDSVKLVIFDLDDTLWRGLIAEDYGAADEPPGYFGWPMGIAEAVHHLRARGILVAVCSKNSELLVRERWKLGMPHGWLSLDDFVAVQINFEPKMENIKKILAATNLTPKNTVFVDDNPVERESVLAALPGIRTLGANPFLTRHILLRAPETQVLTLTAESQNRAQNIVDQRNRDSDRNELSREAFLEKLQCRIQIGVLNDADAPEFARTFELLNKTNQFNTTGMRWTPGEVGDFFKSGGKFVHFTVTDRYSQYGLVGVVAALGQEIQQFVMSCRVLGMDVESGVLRSILEKIYPGNHEVTARFIQTDLNLACRDLYDKNAFTRTSNDEANIVYTLDRTALEPIPKHLTIAWAGD